MPNACQNRSKIDAETGYKNARQKWSKNIQNWVQKCSKIDRQSIRNQCRNEHEFHAPTIVQKQRSAGAGSEQNRSRIGGEPEVWRNKMELKWRQNDANMEPKWSLNWFRNASRFGALKSDDFRSIFDWFRVDFQECFLCIPEQLIYDFCPRSEKCNLHGTMWKLRRNHFFSRFGHYGKSELLIRNPFQNLSKTYQQTGCRNALQKWMSKWCFEPREHFGGILGVLEPNLEPTWGYDTVQQLGEPRAREEVGEG